MENFEIQKLEKSARALRVLGGLLEHDSPNMVEIQDAAGVPSVSKVIFNLRHSGFEIERFPYKVSGERGVKFTYRLRRWHRPNGTVWGRAKIQKYVERNMRKLMDN